MSSTNVCWQQKAAARRTNSGNRPLHASGVSILAMADIAYRKTLEFDGPIGLTWRRIVNLAEPANPIIYAVQFQWLAILSFLDDQFLIVQKIIEKLFPPSSRLFVKNDDLVLVIMSLPEKFDVALNKLPHIIHQIPGLDFVLIHLISWLNCLVSILNHCGLNDSERIDRDENSERIRLISTSESSELCEAESKRDASMAVSTHEGSSYKEALMNDDEDEGDVNASVLQKKGLYKEALMNDDEDEGDVNASVNQKKGSCKEELLMNDCEDKSYVNASVLQNKGSYKEALMNDDEDEGVNIDEAGRNGRMKEDDDEIMGLFESRWAQ